MVDHELDELRREFLAEAAAKVREIQATVVDGRSAQSVERLTYLSHQLKGSGGSYGYERISEEAAEVEKAAERLGGGESGEGIDRKLREHVSNLEKEIETRRKELGGSSS
jgi:HPt (histidine-containing phosphotransfer) domain-containing protein